jgi:peroxiredoxin Q/BCP
MNPLKAGDIAPKFSLPDQDGEEVNLTDFQGQRVLVYFYPKAMTPGCTVQACGLRDNMDDLKKRALKCWVSAPINRKNSPVSPKKSC